MTYNHALYIIRNPHFGWSQADVDEAQQVYLQRNREAAQFFDCPRPARRGFIRKWFAVLGDALGLAAIVGLCLMVYAAPEIMRAIGGQ